MSINPKSYPLAGGSYTLDQLVEIITREVLVAYPLLGGEQGDQGPHCSACPAYPCDGHCVQTNPDGVRRVVSAGADRLTTRLGVKSVAADMASKIDHTLLKPQATEDQFRQLCAEARQFGFATVCVNPAWVPLCAQLLAGSPVKVCTVIGFPLGATLPEVKAFESQRCAALGAAELDMVINVGALKSRQYAVVEEDITAVVNAAHQLGASVKVIIEAAYLTDEEKVEACALSKAAGADYVKTSTGFGPSGATVEDVALMRRVVGPEMGVKAAGGIKTAEEAKAMIAAGATRIGASASVKIVGESEVEGPSTSWDPACAPDGHWRELTCPNVNCCSSSPTHMAVMPVSAGCWPTRQPSSRVDRSARPRRDASRPTEIRGLHDTGIALARRQVSRRANLRNTAIYPVSHG